MARECRECGAGLAKGSSRSICMSCLEKIEQLKSLSYTVTEIANLLRISEEQVRRLGRQGKIPGRVPGKKHLYVKKFIDGWIGSGGKETEGPTNLKARLQKLCRDNDHSWFFEQGFEQYGYISAPVHKASEGITQGIAGYFRTCIFCGYREIVLL